MTTHRKRTSGIHVILLTVLAFTAHPLAAKAYEPAIIRNLPEITDISQAPSGASILLKNGEVGDSENIGEHAEFMGGELQKFNEWVARNLRYPQQAVENNISGTVFARFIVETTGELSNIEILRTPDSCLSDEVIRVMRTSPQWVPGTDTEGNPVRISYTMPVIFRLQ